MTLLELTAVRKSFSSHATRTVALESMSLDVEQGEFVALLGASGCGKTTTLRSIAGLETPDSGEIVIGGKTMFSTLGQRSVFVPPEKRDLGMVFQSYALWPHMTVNENVGFGLTKRGLSKSEIADKVQRALDAVKLSTLGDRRISQLSGGQQQRVAVARAIAPEPRIILFDEPLSNIDARLRESLRLQVLGIQQRMGLTAIWVTHDQDEALGLASRIVLMNNGVVEQIGSPQDVWDRPATAFAAEFIGSSSEIRTRVVEVAAGSPIVDLGRGERLVLPKSFRAPAGTAARIFIRSDTVLVGQGKKGDENSWEAPIVLQKFHGDYTMVIVRLGDHEITFRSSTRIDPGATSLRITIKPESILAFLDEEAAETVPALVSA
jgi:ABC-type Fe3+/spermidine/putrescine transport system ATPase subunit